MSEVKQAWEVGQHPAVSNGWIVRPIMIGSNVRVLPEHEGGHVMFKSEAVAHKVAAAEDVLEALKACHLELSYCKDQLASEGYSSPEGGSVMEALRIGSAAIAKAEGRS